MKTTSQKMLLSIMVVIAMMLGVASASVGQTLRYNFKATSEPSVAGWEDVEHPSNDASLSEVVVTTGGWSLITIPAGWSPIFGATAFAANGETVSDMGAMLSPFAVYALHNTLPFDLPQYPDYNAEFFLTGQFYSSFETNGTNVFADTGVLNSNWSTQTSFNLYGNPSANILLTGLNPAKVYSFKMAGSLESTAGAFLTGTTIYAIGTNLNNVLIQTRGNTSHYATFAGVPPSGAGEISLWAMSAWNPAGYVGMLGGIEVIESDPIDVPVIDFGVDEYRIYQPQSSRNLAPSISVGGGASIVSYRWRQIQGPKQVSFTTPTAASTDVFGMTTPGVYIVELGVAADNGIEQRQRMRVVVDTGKWAQKVIPNGNPAANNGQDIQYLEYLPDDYNTTGCANKNYPVIVYLHGYGQNGRDTEMLKGEGLGYLVDQGLTNLQFTGASGELEKFIAIVPQLSTTVGWDSDDIDAVIAHVMSGTQYRADYNRIYIAGFSYGSLGLWNYLAMPNKSDAFAAAVPSSYVPSIWGAQYCNANGVSIFAMSEADMIQAGYYISSPADFTGFMSNLALCPVTPAAIGQIMTGRDHVEMYHFYWQTDYTGFEGKNIYQWFLDHERNYASGGAGQACFSYNQAVGITVSPGLQTIMSGDTATFTISVINSGSVDLTGLVISSDTEPSCTMIIDYLAQGASTGYMCSSTNVITSFVQNLVVTGYAYTGGVTYTGYSATNNTSAQVNVASLAPNIEITKTPTTQDILSGSTASFTIVVTNTGNVDLTGIVVTDPTVPACSTTIGFLAHGASTSYPCVTSPLYATFSPTSFVSGYAYTGGTAFPSYASQASAVSTVQVFSFNPAIQVVFSPATQTITGGDNALFTVTITNNGDIDLTGLVVTNPTVPGCDNIVGYLPVSGVAGYGCQLNSVFTGFVSTIYMSGYATSGGTDYPGLSVSYATGAVVIVHTSGGSSNIAPTANAGIDQTITLPTNITFLDGSNSSDIDGTVSISLYTWTQLSGPSIATIVPLSGAIGATVQDLGQGTYIFELLVTDDFGATGTDTVTVVVNPSAPTGGGGGGGGNGGYGSFAGGGRSTYNSSSTTQTLSTIPQTSTQTSLSDLPTLTQTAPSAEDNTADNQQGPSLLIKQLPQDTMLPSAPLIGWIGGGTSSSQSDPITNGTAAYKLPFDALRQLISSLVQ